MSVVVSSLAGVSLELLLGHDLTPSKNGEAEYQMSYLTGTEYLMWKYFI